MNFEYAESANDCGEYVESANDSAIAAYFRIYVCIFMYKRTAAHVYLLVCLHMFAL